MYRKLLRSVTHAGVRGLLVHDVKNEVDLALKVGTFSCLSSVGDARTFSTWLHVYKYML